MSWCLWWELNDNIGKALRILPTRSRVLTNFIHGQVAHFSAPLAIRRIFFLGPDSEKAMAAHSSTLAWRIPWTEEPGRLQSMGSLGVGHDWATSLSLSCMGEGNGNPLQCSCLENLRDGGAWWASVYGAAQSWTQLKWLSSSSSSSELSQLIVHSQL